MTRTSNILMAFILAIVLEIIFVAGFNLISAELPKRVFQLLGGYLPGGIIQVTTFFAFFWGLFEVKGRLKRLKVESSGFEMDLLPEKEQWVLSPDDINGLKLKMIALEEQEPLTIVRIIKQACTKFRANNSITEVMNMVSAQIKLHAQRAEGHQNIIRFLTWAIPSIGFIGTIMGIAQALGLADQATDPAILSEITNNMYTAFDTTLVALFLSIILMWYFHRLQEREDHFHTEMEDYLMENLVNRIHVK